MNKFKIKGYLCTKPNGSLYISLSYYLNDKRHRKNVQVPSDFNRSKAKYVIMEAEKQLEKYLLTKEAQYKSGELITSLEDYKYNLQINKSLKQNTKEKYITIIDKFVVYLQQLEESTNKEVFVSNFKQPQLLQYLQYLADYKQLTLETIKSHNTTLLRAINKIRSQKELFPLQNTDFSSLNIERRLPKQKKLFYSDDDIKQILEYLETNEKYKYIIPIFKFCLIYGLRRSEALGLRWNNVNFDANVFYINRTRVTTLQSILEEDSVKAAGSRRIYPVNDLLRQIKIDQSIAGLYSDDQYVFLNNQNKPCNPTYTSRLLKEAIRHLGLDDTLSFKSTRSTVASQLLNQGLSDSQIIKFMGHMDIKVTREHYMQQSLESKSNIVDSLSSKLSSISKK